MATNEKNNEALADRSRAFLTQPKESVLQKHPELAKAYAVRDELHKVVKDTQPLTDTIRLRVEGNINKSVAGSLARGSEPSIKPETIEQVKFQVAFASAEHVAGARRIDPASKTNITPEHREILVRNAEKAFQPNAVRGDAAAEIQTRARETAGLVGLIDLPKSNNPFKADELKAAYAKHQQDFVAKQQDRQNDASRGHDGR